MIFLINLVIQFHWDVFYFKVLSQGIRTNKQLTVSAERSPRIQENNETPLPDFTDLLAETNEDDIFIDQIAQSSAEVSVLSLSTIISLNCSSFIQDEDENFDDDEDESSQQPVRAEAREGQEATEEEEEDDEDVYDEFDDDDDIDFSPLFEDSPNFEAPEGLIERLLQREAEIEARRIPREKRPEIIARAAAKVKYQRHEKDCGSPEVQIAMIHERIIHLTKHLIAHRKDVHCKRGLDRLVTLRRKNLNFLFHQDPKKATALATELGIRFTPPGRPWDRSVKYGSYKNTKKVFKVTKEEQEAKRIRETQRQLEL